MGDEISIGPENVRDVVQKLFLKAREFISAVELETGLRIEASEFRNLQVGLLEDFIEVHNAAAAHMIPQLGPEPAVMSSPIAH
jgi:hypothetical protein